MRFFNKKRVLYFYIGIIIALLIFGCSTTKEKEHELIPPISIQISPEELSLGIGQTRQLQIIQVPGKASREVLWTVSDTTIVHLSVNGVVTALLPGQATVTATSIHAPSVSSSCLVTISNSIDDFLIEINDDESVSITGYTGSDKSIVIPGTIQGKQVSMIGDNAFYNKRLTSLILSQNIVSIGDWAFYKNELQSIVLPASLESIGEAAFGSNNLTSLIIPDNITSIGDRAFMFNQLENVIISENLTTLSSAVFMFNNLESITIPNNITIIELSAFSYNKLVSVIIGDNVQIEDNNFDGNFREVYSRIGGHFLRDTPSNLVWIRM